MNDCDKMFRKWYDDRFGTKSESFAYDVWCAAWAISRQISDANSIASDPAGLKAKGLRLVEKPCNCDSPLQCELNDRCLKNAK